MFSVDTNTKIDHLTFELLVNGSLKLKTTSNKVDARKVLKCSATNGIGEPLIKQVELQVIGKAFDHL